MPIRVLLVDDHRIFRQGIRRVLYSDPEITVIAEASNAADGIRLASELQPDVVLLDVRMKDNNGFDAIGAILDHAPMAAILVFAMYGDKRYVVRSIESGSRKDASIELLIDTIQMVYQGCL
jgi:DNA-binding NarL/FixJ family response regulator